MLVFFSRFIFHHTPTTQIYTLSLHDALPISGCRASPPAVRGACSFPAAPDRSEEHTSELQSHHDLVCRLLFEKNKLGYKVTIIISLYSLTCARPCRYSFSTSLYNVS